MREFTTILLTFLVIVIQAHTIGSISGTVTDQTGAVVPGANVTVQGEAGQQFTAVTKGDGVFTIPGVPAGTPTYTVTITAPSFKKNVKVDVAIPATVNVQLDSGNINETVVVASGAEVLQTETATVGTTTTGVVRTSSVNGLPKSALTIQIDGVDISRRGD
jgi:Carboxypeptidase regulatory-like domain